jgi:hypothetical protein
MAVRTRQRLRTSSIIAATGMPSTVRTTPFSDVPPSTLYSKRMAAW